MLKTHKKTKAKSMNRTIRTAHMRTYRRAQLPYTTHHRTVLITFPQPPDKQHSSDAFYWRRRGTILIENK